MLLLHHGELILHLRSIAQLLHLLDGTSLLRKPLGSELLAGEGRSDVDWPMQHEIEVSLARTTVARKDNVIWVIFRTLRTYRLLGPDALLSLEML